ncbi:MAG: caspase family protein [Winogradskyella sp.]|uniref:caspase family protein n=1 Tax=Winogradskyella sp. TaxID=1883156 RepID=UPI000F4004C7|nr:caspase family protein [Winogradskyella sp.]RNC86715.1 MAG: caspase family protein [Winogradskyella sp.]
MKLQSLLLTLLLPFLFTSSEDFGAKNKAIAAGDLYVISVGIDINTAFGFNLQYCKKDATEFANKLTADHKKNEALVKKLISEKKIDSLRKLKKSEKYRIKSIIPIVLLDKDATLTNIRNAFKTVISKATTNDSFIFNFSGISAESSKNNTFLFPYLESNFPLITEQFEEKPEFVKHIFSLKELSLLMEQIPCKNQYVISEAGTGKAFGLNLMFNLFESNPRIMALTERERTILTTTGIGFEGGKCNTETISNGRLMHSILRLDDITQMITNYKKFELKLNTSLDYCGLLDSDYTKIYHEKDFRDIQLKMASRSNNSKFRGSNGISQDKENNVDNENTNKKYALVLATNEYNKNQSDWSYLKNPINDAESISNILKLKYGFEVIKVYNKSQDEFLDTFDLLKQKINTSDKVIFFVAGHGHKDEYNYGHLVFRDSESLNEDTRLKSYLSLGRVTQILDALPSKHVFSIFDICYGGNLELNEKNLAPENYVNTKFDNGIDRFISDMNNYHSRVILASGADEVPDFWDDSRDHSPFADKLIKALEEEEKFISPGKIFSYVRGNATLPILKKFGKHEVTGDFLIPTVN